jgi:hypothetical protein
MTSSSSHPANFTPQHETLSNLGGETPRERAIRLLEILHTRGRIEEILDYVKEFRQDIDLSEYGIDTCKEPSDQIEFVNRFHEIQFILGPYSPDYILISAPAGYGKTELLKVVRDQFRKQGWISVFVELAEQEINSSTKVVERVKSLLKKEEGESGSQDKSLKEHGYDVAGFFYEKSDTTYVEGALLIIDGLECLDDEDTEVLLSEFVPGFIEGMRFTYAGPLKVIIAGRYIAESKELSQQLPWNVMSLKPFSFQIVQKTVEKFSQSSGKLFLRNHKLDIAAHLMHITGGHPKCMADILESWPPGWSARRYLVEREDHHYTEWIRPVIKNIRDNIPEKLCEIMDTLSVVRRFNDQLVRCFIDKGFIDWDRSEDALIDQLKRTYLVNQKEGFVQDDITRRLLAIRLSKSNPDRFSRINQVSLSFYEDRLASEQPYRPDILAVEAFFQRLQYYHPNDLSSKQVIEWLSTLTESLSEGRDLEVVQGFVELLEKDWELQFMVNYYLRTDGYRDEPFNRLLMEVRKICGEEEDLNA